MASSRSRGRGQGANKPDSYNPIVSNEPPSINSSDQKVDSGAPSATSNYVANLSNIGARPSYRRTEDETAGDVDYGDGSSNTNDVISVDYSRDDEGIVKENSGGQQDFGEHESHNARLEGGVADATLKSSNMGENERSGVNELGYQQFNQGSNRDMVEMNHLTEENLAAKQFPNKMEQQEEVKRQEEQKQLEQQNKSYMYDKKVLKVSVSAILAIFCVVGGIGLLYFRPIDSIDPIKPKHQSNSYIKYCKKLSELSRYFHSQSNEFWNSVRVVAKPVFDDAEPISPAVTIFVAKTESEFRAARCLSRKVAAAVTDAFGSKPAGTINGGMKDTPGKVKLRIDETVTEKLNAGGRVVIVDELEKLHGEAALMFHSFCDNENAPFKRAMFIFTLFAGEQASAHEGVDDVVEKMLKRRWSQHIDRDTIDPLLGRIGNNNVFIKSESDGVLDGCA